MLQASTAFLPRVLPAPIQSGSNCKIKSHDKTTKRSILRVEIAEQAANKAEKEQARELAQAVKEERVPDTQGRPITPVQRKRTHTLVERTPGKPPIPGRLAPGLALVLRDHLHLKCPRQLPQYHHHLQLQLGLPGLAERKTT